MVRSYFSLILAVLVIGQMSCTEKLEVLHSAAAPADPGVATPLVAQAVCDVPVAPVATDHPTSIVGNGTLQSCTDQALGAAVALGGVIIFRCGSQPATLDVSSEKLVARDTTLDGGGLITLSGGDQTRILHLRGADPPNGPRLTIQNLTLERGLAPFTPNDDVQSSGGAILQEGGTLVIHNSAFRHNATPSQAPAASGGAIAGQGDTTIIGSLLENNTSGNGGAVGMSQRSLTIVNSRLQGNAALTQGASMASGRGGAVSIITDTSVLSICGTEISTNSSNILGGALFLSMISGGTATIDRSTLNANQCNDPSGDPNAGPDAGSAPPSGRVGAVYAQGVALAITSSTISNNQSSSLAALFVAGFADRQVTGSVDLVNVTVADNRAYRRTPITSTGIGGGLWIGEITQGRVLNCTIVGNEAQFGAGIMGFSSLTIDNSIVSNKGLNLYNSANCYDLATSAGATSRGSHDLQWPASNGSGNPDVPCTPGTTFADPMLADLVRDPGTSTSTMAPRAGSPALGQGQSCPPTDQRGKPRKTPCTLGAYESDL